MSSNSKSNENIKNKDRVLNFGEVNTSSREINEMLDLVKNETQRLDSRFLEPACGDGNFLINVLERKLEVLIKKYSQNKYEFEKYGILLVGSIYGIDILKDNVLKARQRLIDKFVQVYKKCFRKNLNRDFIESVKFIVQKNILYGDAINFQYVDSDKPLVFSEWSIFKNKIKRRDFVFSELFIYSDFNEPNLFSQVSEDVEIPPPLKTFPLVNFDKVYEIC